MRLLKSTAQLFQSYPKLKSFNRHYIDSQSSDRTLKGSNMEPKIEEARGLPTKKLGNKVAVITGGARGIGGGVAQLFAKHGAHVVVADVLDDLGAALAESIGGRYIHCDVSKEADVEAAVKLALEWKGRIDIMLNNAGISGPAGSIANLDMEKVQQLLSVNTFGCLHGIKHASAAMMKNRTGGSIICTSSSAALIGGLGGHAYTLSKESINGLVRSTACELGVYGIRVNSISPHGVPTEILVTAYKDCLGNQNLQAEDVGKIVGERGSLLRGRYGTVKDVAEAALYLASEDSGFITAHNLVLDGGYTSAVSTMSKIYQ